MQIVIFLHVSMVAAHTGRMALRLLQEMQPSACTKMQEVTMHGEGNDVNVRTQYFFRVMGRTSGVLMTVSESLFHLDSLQSSFRPQPSTALRVPSANLCHHASILLASV